MFEVGGVVHARRHDDDRGVIDAHGGDGAQVVEQHVRVMVDGRDAVAREQFREQPHHHLAVFQHVGHAGGHAQVVFQHIEFALARAHDVDAGDVGVNVGGDGNALHFRAVLGILVYLLGRNDARLDDVLLMINIMDEHVQGLHALHQARLHLRPFGGGDDAGDGVERNQAFRAGIVAIDGERDADPAKRQVGFGPLAGDGLGGLLLQPVAEFTIVFTYLVVRTHVICSHFIEKICHVVISLEPCLTIAQQKSCQCRAAESM
ncbi:hypothetical protein D3C87_993670 [compost metagenome]